MANRLKMALQNAIIALWKRGWSYRRIARELDVHRDTVSGHVRHVAGESKPAISTAGSGGSEVSKAAISTAGFPGRRSHCELYRELIDEKLEAGLSAQRIYQDLRHEHGFTASYESVKRFVARLGKVNNLPFRRMEREPGMEAQVDFGKGAPIHSPDGRRRRSHVLRPVLSCSRKGYSEAVFRQTTENFIRCLEDAFWDWGGVPATLVIDNLRAAVSNPDWFDPELNPKMESFCRHYGTVILPARPYMARHKGKVERGIGYVKDNALKGRVFKSLEEQNQFLQHWERQVADKRIHGTTRKQVEKVFEEIERPALLPLPRERFPYFKEAQRRVHRDGHVEVEKAYYSVPPEYVGREVWVRWDSRILRVFNTRFEEIGVHAKKEPGRFSTAPAHIASEKISAVERGATALLRRTTLIGPNACKWAETMLEARGVRGVRVLQGLLSLVRKYEAGEVDRACECALSYGAFRLKSLRTLLKRSQKQESLEFIDEHPVIRGMAEYGRLVRVSFSEEGGKIVEMER
jgi:transposase